MSVYFYDNVKNNGQQEEVTDKYWNDTWMVTYKNKKSEERKNCENCGASMEYEKNFDMYTCKYCGNTRKNSESALDWVIENIEVVE